MISLKHEIFLTCIVVSPSSVKPRGLAREWRERVIPFQQPQSTVRFTYTYRSSDGERHTAEIEAENRDAAFAKIRTELGIKPIKVNAVDAANDSVHAVAEKPRGRAKMWGAVVVTAAILSVAGGALWWMRRASNNAPYQVMTPQGPITYITAMPLPRQKIPGDRMRIEAARQTAFQSSAERFLALFAEPGRTTAAEQADATPADDEFKSCLGRPIRIASNDFTEVVDLKRIVTSMKREMQAYLAGGGTAREYCEELAKRQKLETSYRENAEKRLAGMLANPKEAYAYWLKANASLKSMGIYELPLPDALHSFQSKLDLD